MVLQPERDKPIRQGHPWVFSGAIHSLPASVPDGEMVDVLSPEGDWLARGYLNRQSQIQVRILSWHKEATINDDFWRTRFAQSIARRAGLEEVTSAFRLINGENDYLPGLIVDR